MDNTPDKPLADYPKADASDLPPLPPSGAEGEQLPALAARRPPREIALLRFLDPAAIRKAITLQFPFALESGEEVRGVTVRRLSSGEVGEVIEDLRARGSDDLDEIYAAMIGHPAAVLRGMMPEDAQAVREAAAPFLPPLLRPGASSPTGTTGAPTSSPPPGSATSG